MSNIYMTEPPTSGKVLLHTDFGDVDIELWPKEAPLAVRNFVQLSLEGYYDNTPIHRIVKDFMCQAGDPTGTGEGGESIWGRPFKDEAHGRIRFNHRGQVAMANENKPNSNHSQFFITFDACEWINRKHTIFGKVTGNTIFNVMRLNEYDVDEKERPTDKILIRSVEVLWNPFEDIIPRDLSGMKKQNEPAIVETTKRAKKGTKNLKLLSFGEEEEEALTDTKRMKIHSSHDSVLKPTDSRLSSEVDAAIETNDKEADLMNLKEENLRLEIQHQLKRHANAAGAENEVSGVSVSKIDQKKGAPVKDEFDQLKRDLLNSRRAVQVLTGADAKVLMEETAFRDMSTPLEQRRQQFIKKKKLHGDRQQETLDKLKKFTSGFRSSKKTEVAPKAKEATAYHGQVMEHDNSDDEDKLTDDWASGKLKFKKHIDDSSRLGIDSSLQSRLDDNYVVIDDRDNRNKR